MKTIKKTFIIIIIVIIVVILIGVISHLLREKQFNKIVFKNPPQQVEDSLVALIQLSSKIPGGCKNFYRGYDGYTGDILVVNDTGIYNIDEIKDYQVLKKYEVFKNHTVNEIARMIKLLHFLDDNYISGVGRQSYSNLLICDYHDLSTGRLQDYRDIIYVENNDITRVKDLLRGYQILDRKGNLLLVAPIEAKIDTSKLKQ